jgi:predicted lipid-binding transport protein (Tim44 family)
MLDIIIFAIIAGFILTKLFKSLGKVEEDDDAPTQAIIHRMRQRQRDNDSADINIASAFEASLPQKVRDVFDQARKINHDFNPETFLKGSKSAFEMIVKAFSKGDKATLKSLLNKEVFSSFANEIDRRNEMKEMHETTIVGIKSCEIIDAELNNNILTISVKFASEQINLIKDHLGNVIIGNASKIDSLHDIWTFAKHLKTSNTIWELIETKSA